jgi:hypothetical protein
MFRTGTYCTVRHMFIISSEKRVIDTFFIFSYTMNVFFYCAVYKINGIYRKCLLTLCTITYALYINYPIPYKYMCSPRSSFILKKHCVKRIVLSSLIKTPLGVSLSSPLGIAFFSHSYPCLPSKLGQYIYSTEFT